MAHNRQTTEMYNIVAHLRSYDAPGPKCAKALDLAGEDGWNPENRPWLSDDDHKRRDAIEVIIQAYRQAARGQDVQAGAELARTVATQMTAGSGAYMSQRYLAATTRQTPHQDSFNHIMTLASEMHTEEEPLTIERIALGLAKNAPDHIDSSIRILLRRVSQAEEATETGDVVYTDSTETTLAARIDQAIYQRGILLVGYVEAEVRRTLPGHLSDRPGLKLWDLYGHPAAVAVYAEGRDSLELAADRTALDMAVAAMPWPTPVSRYSWSLRQILDELLRLHRRSIERAQDWDGTIDFSY